MTFSVPGLRRQRAGLVFIAISIWLDQVAQSSSFPVLPRLAEHLLHGDRPAAARWVGVLEVGWVIPQLIAMPVIGMLSDRFGRRPVILVSVFGVGAELVLNALSPGIWWLLAGRVLCGLTCGAQAAAMAYVADVTEPQDRTRAYGRMNAAIWTAIIMGPALGGLLAGINIRAPFWAAAAFAIAGGVYGLIVLPESLPAARRAPLRWARANAFGALGLIASRPGLPALGLVCFILWLAFQANQNVIVLYTQHRYGWTPFAFGAFCSAAAVVNIGLQSFGVAAIARRIGERWTVVTGLVVQAIGLAATGLAPGAAAFWAASVFVWLGNIAGPALQSLMTAKVAPSEQGRLQGAIGTVDGVGGLIAPIAATQLFAWTIAPGRPPAWSGAALLAAAVLTLIGMGVVAAGGRPLSKSLSGAG